MLVRTLGATPPVVVPIVGCWPPVVVVVVAPPVIPGGDTTPGSPGPGDGALGTGTAAGSMRKPPSRSISSSVIGRFWATLESDTWNRPSAPSVGAPVV